ncbi:hypothetical protein ON010_g3000 [Phytophthora cinnamomi]|nr:hypothetical protein ON010_g3000 [Phytophthora cinnamomi]
MALCTNQRLRLRGPEFLEVDEKWSVRKWTPYCLEDGRLDDGGVQCTCAGIAMNSTGIAAVKDEKLHQGEMLTAFGNATPAIQKVQANKPTLLPIPAADSNSSVGYKICGLLGRGVPPRFRTDFGSVADRNPSEIRPSTCSAVHVGAQLSDGLYSQPHSRGLLWVAASHSVQTTKPFRTWFIGNFGLVCLPNQTTWFGLF